MANRELLNANLHSNYKAVSLAISPAVSRKTPGYTS